MSSIENPNPIDRLTIRNYGKVIAMVLIIVFLGVSMFLASNQSKKKARWDSNNKAQVQSANNRMSQFEDSENRRSENPDPVIDRKNIPEYHLIYSRLQRNERSKKSKNPGTVEFRLVNEYWSELSKEELDKQQEERRKEIDGLLAKGIKHDEFDKHLKPIPEHAFISIKMSQYFTRKEAEKQADTLVSSGMEKTSRNPFKEGSFSGAVIGDRCWRLDLKKLSGKALKRAENRTNLFFLKNNVIVELEVKTKDKADYEFVEELARKIAEKY
jgi:hypothetical protein